MFLNSLEHTIISYQTMLNFVKLMVDKSRAVFLEPFIMNIDRLKCSNFMKHDFKFNTGIVPYCCCSSITNFASPLTVYYSLINGLILMFKVCKLYSIEVPKMMRSFSGGSTTPLVVKIWTKQPWVKIENSRNFDCNFVLFRGKIWLWLFYDFFCVIALRFYKKKFKSFQAKMKVWRWFFWFNMKSKSGKIAVTPSFLVKKTGVES